MPEVVAVGAFQQLLKDCANHPGPGIVALRTILWVFGPGRIRQGQQRREALEIVACYALLVLGGSEGPKCSTANPLLTSTSQRRNVLRGKAEDFSISLPQGASMNPNKALWEKGRLHPHRRVDARERGDAEKLMGRQMVKGLVSKSTTRYRHLVAGFGVVCMLGVVACAQIEKDEASASLASQQPPPPWAYPFQPPVNPLPDDGVPRRVPESAAAITLTQVRDLYTAPDWHPTDHPPMPGVVGIGRKPDMFACGYCHYPNGQGRPENASLAGLSATYIAQQVADYKNGLRKSSDPTMRAPAFMVANAKSATQDDVRLAAEYFASVKYKPWIRVVETETVPKTYVAGFMLVPLEGATSEPIGQRIIEIAEDLSRTTLRDPRSGFIAYVPVGSVKRGETLVTTGGRGKTAVCATCHGQDLKGLGDIPPLAGRSPSYTVRQLYDFQSGARAGPLSIQMKQTVAQLTSADMVSIAAYVASRAP